MFNQITTQKTLGQVAVHLRNTVNSTEWDEQGLEQLVFPPTALSRLM